MGIYYRIVYECKNGMIATWEDYAISEDEFISDFLKLKSERMGIKRINSLERRIENPYKEITLDAEKYNRQYGFETKPVHIKK